MVLPMIDCEDKNSYKFLKNQISSTYVGIIFSSNETSKCLYAG